MHRQRPLSCPSQPQGHGRVAFLPFVPVTLKALKPKDIEAEPKTLGEHLKRWRLQIGLSQKEAAATLGVSEFTLINWEGNVTTPAVRFFSDIVRFLRYDPNPAPTTFAEQLQAKRRELGWSIKQAAMDLGVDERTWAKWESGSIVRQERHHALITAHIKAIDE